MEEATWEAGSFYSFYVYTASDNDYPLWLFVGNGWQMNKADICSLGMPAMVVQTDYGRQTHTQSKMDYSNSLAHAHRELPTLIIDDLYQIMTT